MKRKKGIKVLCFGLVALFLTICIGTKNYDVSAADTLELSNGCTIEIDSITPKNDIEASAYISGFLIQNVEDCYGGFLISDNPGDYTSGSLSVMCIAGTETYDNVKIKYREENKEVSRKITEYVGELHGTECFPVNDLDLIDYYKSGCKSDTHNAFAYFSSEYKERFKNTNISLIIDVRAGDGGNFFTVLAGIGSLYYDGIAYAASEFLGGSLENVIYVPTDTPEADLMKVAQTRINDYLGDESVQILDGGNTADLNYFDYDETSLDLPEGIEKYYKLKIDDSEYNILIVPDSSKMIQPPAEKKTVDAATNISIATTSKSVPVDATIKASAITSGQEYEKIMEKLNVENSQSFDLKLYSNIKDEYITSVEDGYFSVNIPVPDFLKDKELAVYYVSDDGKIEEYPVTINGDNAEFKTNHFSIYTLAEKKSSGDVDSSDAGMAPFVCLAILACATIVLTVAVKTKRETDSQN